MSDTTTPQSLGERLPEHRSRVERLLAHAGWVRALSRSLLRDPNQADDVEQETWVAALEYTGSTVRDDRAWLGGVFRNVVRQARRTGSRRQRRESEVAHSDSLPSVDEIVERAEMQRRVVQAVVELDEPYRSTVLFCFFEELSCEEVARRQGISGSTVRNRLKRGLEQLRERFDREHGGDRAAWAVALAPLAAPPLGAGIGTGLAGPIDGGGSVSAPDMTTATLTATTSTGTIAMSFKVLLATTAAAALTLGSTGLFRAWTASTPTASTPESGSNAVVVAAASDRDASESDEVTAALARPLDIQDDAQQDEKKKQTDGTRQPVEVPTKYFLAGRVIDQDGAPVAGATVFVGGRPNPFEGAPNAGLRVLERDEMKRGVVRFDGEFVERDLNKIRREKGQRAEELREHDRDVERVEKAERERQEREEKEARARSTDAGARERTGRTEDEIKERELDEERARLTELEFRAKQQHKFKLRELRYIEGPLEREPRHWAEVDPKLLAERGVVLGRQLVTNADGRFETSFTESQPVYVTIIESIGVHRTASGAWHDRPTQGVVLEVERYPTASVTVWMKDVTTGERRADWTGVMKGGRHYEELPRVKASGWTKEVELRGETPYVFELAVQKPTWAAQTARFELSPGEKKEIEIEVTSGAGYRGVVVDSLHQPIAGAFVYWGELLELRGNTIFGVYDPERAIGAVRTDEAGNFHLPGEAQRISVWHSEFSPASALPLNGQTITLAQRGTIKGAASPPSDDEQHVGEVKRRLAEYNAKRAEFGTKHLPGADVSFGRAILLDSRVRAEVDELGAFTFEDVEAGVHSVAFGERWFTGVHVDPGETVNVTWTDFLPRVHIEVQSNGHRIGDGVSGYVVGLDRIFTLAQFEAEPTDAGQLMFELEWQRPGRYLLYTRSGWITTFDVVANHAIADVGTGELIVHTEPGRHLFLVPENLTTNAIAMRVASIYPKEVGESGSVTWEPIATGNYTVFDRSGAALATIAVTGPGTEHHLSR